MSDKRRKKTITKEQYFALLDAGVPYEGSVEGVGYVLKEVVVVAKRINKYNDRFLQLATVQVCVVDNPYHSMTQKNRERAKVTEDSLKRERRKAEAREKFSTLVKRFYGDLIRDHKEEKNKYELDLNLFENKISKNLLCIADIPGKLQNTEECKTYFSYYDNIPYYNYDQGEIKEYKPSLPEKVRDAGFLGRILYGMGDGIYVTAQVALLQMERRHLDGSSVVGEEAVDSGIDAAMTLIPVSKIPLSVGIGSKTLSMGKYSKMMNSSWTKPIPGKVKKEILNSYNQIIMENNKLIKDLKIIEYTEDVKDFLESLFGKD